MRLNPCDCERPRSHVPIIDRELANREECDCEFHKTS
jgi:hypothetical protein